MNGPDETPMTFPFIGGGSFIFDQPDTVESLWGDGDDVLWARGEALMICGPSGVGKTTLTGQLVRGLLGLEPTVLGYTVTPVPRTVLYLAMDRPRQIRRSLRRHFTASEQAAIDDHLKVWQGPPWFDVAKHPYLLRDMARQAEADVVIVDSLKDAAVGLVDDAVGAGYNRARQNLLVAGVEVLELHHQKKSGANGSAPDTLADVYGSTWITSGAGSVIGLWGDAGDPIVDFKHLKQPMNPVGPFKVVHHHDRGRSEVYEPTDLVSLAQRGLTVSDAARATYGEKPSLAEREKIRRRLDRLTRDGALTKTAIADSQGRDVSVWHPAKPSQDDPRQTALDT